MDINFSNIKTSFQNFNFNDSTVGKFVNENKKAIQLVALGALSAGTAYVAYNKFNAPITAEDACHEIFKTGINTFPELEKGLTKAEYELTSAAFNEEALTDTTQEKVYLTCVAKLTEKNGPTLKARFLTKNEAILAGKEFNVQADFARA